MAISPLGSVDVSSMLGNIEGLSNANGAASAKGAAGANGLSSADSNLIAQTLGSAASTGASASAAGAANATNLVGSTGTAVPSFSINGGAATGSNFSQILSDAVGQVNAKMEAGSAAQEKLLTGETGNIHQAMIATQEGNVAFSMMIEVRNKLVESYQELMRMQV